MNISDILGDAFLADKRLRAPREFGTAITQSHTEATYDASNAIDPKCNLVGTLKSDNERSRNSIASNRLFVCYSVKGVSIRVIHTGTAEKDLLRGTEPLTDMRFSSTDSSLLCSSTANNITVWKLLSTETSLTNEVVCVIPLGADFIMPHPTHPHMWAVAYKHHIALFCSSHVPVTSASSYTEIGPNLGFNSDVVDMTFTPSGSHLAVAAGVGKLAAVGVFALPSGPLTSTAVKLTPYSMVPCSHVVGVSIPRIVGSSISLLTLTVTEDAKVSESHLLLRAWTLNEGRAVVETQSVQLSLPRSEGFQPTTDHRYALELQHGENPQVVVVYDRASSVAACFTLSSKLPLSRYVYLALQWNVVSLVVHTVHGVDSLTSEEVEYLELASYQRDTHPGSQQISVKQYHIPLSSIAASTEPPQVQQIHSTPTATTSPIVKPHSPALPTAASTAPVAHTPASKPLVDSTAPPPVTAAGNVVSTILAPSAAVVAGSFPDFALKKPAAAAPTMTVKVTPASTTVTPTDSDIGTRSKDILLSALRARPAECAPQPASLPKHKIETQKSVESVVSESSKASKHTKTKRSASETPITTPLDVNGVDHDWENASMSASSRRVEDPIVSARLQHLESSMNSVEHILKDLQKTSVRTAKHVTEQFDANKTWQQNLSSELAASLKADFVAEAVTAVKAELSREFREAFERTLVPAFQRGVAEAFTQLQDEVSASVMRLNKDLQRVVQIKTEENRELSQQIQELRSEVQSLTSIVEASELRSRSQSLAEVHAPNTLSPHLLVTEGRYVDALELALELKDVPTLLAVLREWSPISCVQECDHTILLCTLQQLAADLASHEPEEGMPARLEWMKVLVIELQTRPDPKMQPVMAGILSCLRAAEVRHRLSVRTDMRMIISVISARLI